MEFIYILFLGAIGIIVAIGIGIELSKDIDEFVISFLFWLLYIITIATFINIILVSNYYLTMRNKTGLQGKEGKPGEDGDTGQSGICDPECRDGICEKEIIKWMTDELKDRSTSPAEIKFDNIYIRSKIKQMCGSDEFKQLAPYNGPKNLIKYIKDIWKIWFDKLYAAGGIQYFENIAAETEFEWNTDNPFSEIKKYDVFYWGLGKQYRPKIVDKCYDSKDGVTINTDVPSSVLYASQTNLFELLGSYDKLFFYRAKQFTYKGAVYYPVGDLVIGPNSTNHDIIIDRKVGQTVFHTSGGDNSEIAKGPNRESIIVTGDVLGPINYNLIWNNDTFWIWRPIAPVGYISLGDVVTLNASPPLKGDKAPIKCVMQSLTKTATPNGNVFWSDPKSNIMMLGFKPNDTGEYVPANINTAETHCYNMFRGIIGKDSYNIPSSDINAQFRYLDITKFDSDVVIGGNISNPALNRDANRIGKGYMNFDKKDSKYSILPYLNLKNSVTLKHTQSENILNGTLVENAISNAYLIKIPNTATSSNKCLNFDGSSITLANCDQEKTNQQFSIIFTGNSSKECKLQYIGDGIGKNKVIKYKSDIFTLVEASEPNDSLYQMFVLS